jgi:predicted transcriptional regulator
MIISAQMRAARALLGIDQRQLAAMAGLSLPTIQRMEASVGQVRGNIDTLMKVIKALEGAGVELIGENAPTNGIGRGVRLRDPQPGSETG